MLILSHADGFGVNFYQLCQRVLQPAGNKKAPLTSPSRATEKCRVTTLLHRLLTENGLTKCHYTPALSRALPFRSKVLYVQPDGSGAMFTGSVTASALTCPDSLMAGKTGYSPFHCLFSIHLPYNIAQSSGFVNKWIGLLPVLC